MVHIREGQGCRLDRPRNLRDLPRRPPRAAWIEKWRKDTPDGFLFSATCPQVITQEKMLGNCDDETTSFLQAISGLGERLGPLLVPLPYGFKPDAPDDRYGTVIVDRSERIAWWAERVIEFLTRGQRVWVTANNHDAGHSPASIEEMRRVVGSRLAE